MDDRAPQITSHGNLQSPKSDAQVSLTQAEMRTAIPAKMPVPPSTGATAQPPKQDR